MADVVSKDTVVMHIPKAMVPLVQYLVDLFNARFYGVVTLNYQAGIAGNASKEREIKKFEAGRDRGTPPGKM